MEVGFRISVGRCVVLLNWKWDSHLLNSLSQKCIAASHSSIKWVSSQKKKKKILFVRFETFKWSLVRPCVSVRLSDFGIISWIYTGKVDNRNTNISVHFRIAFPYRQGFPFENFRTFSNISKVQNHWTTTSVHQKWSINHSKMVKNRKSCFSRPLSVLGRFWMRFWNVCIWPKIPVCVRHFRHIPKIPVYFRHFRHIPKIPVYFWTGVSNLNFRENFR